MPTPLIPDMAVFQRKLATLPLATYQAGETVLSAASTTGQLLILKEGSVAVVKEGVEIARVTEPGAVFGELPCCWISRTRPTYARLKPRSFMSPMRPPSLG
jgi:signal-transduction protein with cAMP-binding, CBS, and nucleotidyltransferase domain